MVKQHTYIGVLFNTWSAILTYQLCATIAHIAWLVILAHHFLECNQWPGLGVFTAFLFVVAPEQTRAGK